MMRDGWSSSYQQPQQQAPPAKRNIGALARMGLLRSDPNGWGQLRSAQQGQRQQMQRAYRGAARMGRSSPLAAAAAAASTTAAAAAAMEKRHLGSLARSGWLQAFRPARAHRYTRSGRGESESDDTVGSCDVCSLFLSVSRV